MGDHADYSDPETALIEQLWTSGHSASEVARAVNVQFRTGRSRNAIIGKVMRLGLQGRDRPSIPRPPKAAAPKLWTAPKPARAPKPSPAPALAAPVVAPVKAGDEWPMPATAKTLLDLGAGECRFPVGAATGEGQLFCAARAPKGDAYCPACRTVVGGKTPVFRDTARLPRWARA